MAGLTRAPLAIATRVGVAQALVCASNAHGMRKPRVAFVNVKDYAALKPDFVNNPYVAWDTEVQSRDATPVNWIDIQWSE